MTLLYAIETCLRRTKLPPSRFGRDAVKDPRLVHDLRRGRSPGPNVERRVREYIAIVLENSKEADAATASESPPSPASCGGCH